MLIDGVLIGGVLIHNTVCEVHVRRPTCSWPDKFSPAKACWTAIPGTTGEIGQRCCRLKEGSRPVEGWVERGGWRGCVEWVERVGGEGGLRGWVERVGGEGVLSGLKGGVRGGVERVGGEGG